MSFYKDGHAERIADKETKRYYIPRREVIREDASNKIRVVLNPSAGATSLNDLLYKGEAQDLEITPH